jgi:uncharacterized protein YprB with RNaseH-like and TPR domain
MIRRTFQLVPGIGPWREKDIWARGLATWSDFLREDRPVAVSTRVDAATRAKIREAQVALHGRDLAALGRLLPVREHWRCYPDFAQQSVFLDVEADGDRSPTVVSLFHGQGLEVFIRDRNLDALPQALERWPLWVTFNGACFDLPILAEHFQGLARPALHIDLRVLFRRLRFSGGLKSIEDALGISRPPHLRGTRGPDAVLLWRTYQETRNIEALRFLVEYNLYDAFQLRSLMEHGYNLATEDLACEVDRLVPFDRGEVLYDVSRLLLALAA